MLNKNKYNTANTILQSTIEKQSHYLQVKIKLKDKVQEILILSMEENNYKILLYKFKKNGNFSGNSQY